MLLTLDAVCMQGKRHQQNLAKRAAREAAEKAAAPAPQRRAPVRKTGESAVLGRPSLLSKHAVPHACQAMELPMHWKGADQAIGAACCAIARSSPAQILYNTCFVWLVWLAHTQQRPALEPYLSIWQLDGVVRDAD